MLPKVLLKLRRLFASPGLVCIPAVLAYHAHAAQPDTRPLSTEERAQVEAITRELQRSAEQGLRDPRLRGEVQGLARRADDIANQEMSEERNRVLRFLGLDPEGKEALYLFVSWSMPLPILRSYALEAMWTGAALVFRGVPPGRKIADFFLQDLRQLVYDKGASAVISLDPRLYDLYQVTVVPSIVLTRDRSNPVCSGAGERRLEGTEKPVSIELCPPVEDSQYWKISGAVTLDYALESFHAAGSENAVAFLQALRRGYGGDGSPPKLQQPFRGEWKDALSPAALIGPHRADR